jgi:hypothetical protein
MTKLRMSSTAAGAMAAVALILVPVVSLAGIPGFTIVKPLAANPNTTVAPIESKSHGKTYSSHYGRQFSGLIRRSSL